MRLKGIKLREKILFKKVGATRGYYKGCSFPRLDNASFMTGSVVVNDGEVINPEMIS